jgi:hypothetical protein
MFYIISHRKKEIKATVRYHSTPKKQETSAGEDMQQLEPSSILEGM